MNNDTLPAEPLHQEPETDTDPLLGSGFEDEQPEPDFDERM